MMAPAPRAARVANVSPHLDRVVTGYGLELLLRKFKDAHVERFRNGDGVFYLARGVLFMIGIVGVGTHDEGAGLYASEPDLGELGDGAFGGAGRSRSETDFVDSQVEYDIPRVAGNVLGVYGNFGRAGIDRMPKVSRAVPR